VINIAHIPKKKTKELNHSKNQTGPPASETGQRPNLGAFQQKVLELDREKQNAVSKYPIAVSNQSHRAA
jgi:hypothetical protein